MTCCGEELVGGEKLTGVFEARNARNLKCHRGGSERKEHARLEVEFNRKSRRDLRLTLPPSLVVFLQWPSVPCSSFCTTTGHDSAVGSDSPTSAPFRGSWSRHSSNCVEARFRHSAPDERTPEFTREVKRSECDCPDAGTRRECGVRSTQSYLTTCGWLRRTRCVPSSTLDTAPSHGAIVITSARTTKHDRPFAGRGSCRSTDDSIARCSIRARRCWRANTVFAHSPCTERHPRMTIIAAQYISLAGKIDRGVCCSKSKRTDFFTTWCGFSSAR